MTEIIDLLKKYTDGKQNTEKVEISVIQLNRVIKALEQEPCETIEEIPKDYKYDTETKDFLVYRHMYTGHEIHIEKPVPRYRLEQTSILDKIRAEIGQYEADCRLQGGTDECEKCNSNVFGSIYRIIDKYKAEREDKE